MRPLDLAARFPKFLLYSIGYLIIITIPTAFFLFGWKGVDIHCQRDAAGKNPSCEVSESLGIHLFSRTKKIKDVLQIGYRSDVVTQTGRLGMTKNVLSTIVFVTEGGEAQITHSVGSASEKELILKTREFLNNSAALEFKVSASLRSIFGWIGLVGTSIILLVVLEVARYNFFRRRDALASPMKFPLKGPK